MYHRIFRALLLTVTILFGCGQDKPAGDPASPSDVETALTKRANELADGVCACKDARCAIGAQEAINQWANEILARRSASPEEAAAIQKALGRATDCSLDLARTSQ